MRVLALSGLVALAPAAAQADSGDRFDGGTLAVQAGGGLLGAAVGGAALGLAGIGIGAAITGPKNWGPPIAFGAMGVVVGGLVGGVVSVKLVGDWRGGNGGWIGTTLGLVAGAATLGAIAAVAEHARLRPPWPAKVAIGATLLIGGPIVGYQLTNDGNRDVMFALPAVRF